MERAGSRKEGNLSGTRGSLSWLSDGRAGGFRPEFRGSLSDVGGGLREVRAHPCPPARSGAHEGLGGWLGVFREGHRGRWLGLRGPGDSGGTSGGRRQRQDRRGLCCPSERDRGPWGFKGPRSFERGPLSLSSGQQRTEARAGTAASEEAGHRDPGDRWRAGCGWRWARGHAAL